MRQSFLVFCADFIYVFECPNGRNSSRINTLMHMVIDLDCSALFTAYHGFSEESFTFAMFFRWEGVFVAFRNRLQSISRASEIKKPYFQRIFIVKSIFFLIFLMPLSMAKKPPPTKTLTTYKTSMKSIFSVARFSFLLLKPQKIV